MLDMVLVEMLKKGYNSVATYSSLVLVGHECQSLVVVGLVI